MSDIINELKMITPSTHPRMTYSLSLHHQIPGEDAKPFRASGDLFLNVIEVPYERTLTVGNQFVPLDFGWIKAEDLKHIILFNITGKARTILPTDEQKAEDASAIVVLSEFSNQEFAPGTMPAVIHVGPGFKGTNIKSLGGNARLVYYGIPK